MLGRMLEDEIKSDMSPLRPEFKNELKIRKADAQLRLGQLFKLGTCDVGNNGTRAVELYNQALDNGNIYAAYSLGRLFEYGVNGIPPDPTRALELYTEAMNAGVGPALNEVARL